MRARPWTNALRALSSHLAPTSSAPVPDPTIYDWHQTCRGGAEAILPTWSEGTAGKINKATTGIGGKEQRVKTSGSFAEEAVVEQCPQRNRTRVSSRRRPRSALAATNPRSSGISIGVDGVKKEVGGVSRGGVPLGAGASSDPGRRPMVGGRSNAARPCNVRVGSS